jgi:metal-responsive CopG/Arc/MetJ family transcriptional regulator
MAGIKKVNVSISIDPNFLRRIDTIRGSIPRSTFMVDTIRKKLGGRNEKLSRKFNKTKTTGKNIPIS